MLNILVLASFIPSLLSSSIQYTAKTAYATSTPQAPIVAQVQIATSTLVSIYIDQTASKMGLTDDFKSTLECESSLNPEAFNKNDPNGGSKGVAQFQDSTFAYYAKQMGKVNADVWNYKDSIDVAAYMFSKGLQNHWSCYKIISQN